MIVLYLLQLSFILIPKIVTLHLEKIPRGITHTGISFKNDYKNVRYDFRAFNENNTCITSQINNKNGKNLFKLYPNIYQKNFNKIYRHILENFLINEPYTIKRDVILGSTEKSFQEIEDYSNLINTKYILGVYDCRHYVDKMSTFCETGHIPVWRLNRYFND